jgi:hypothetical protein
MSPARGLSRRRRLDRQSMQTRLQFRTEKVVDRSMPVDPAHAGEGLRNDADTKMCFAGSVKDRMLAGFDMVMARMQVAFVDHQQALRLQCLGERLFNPGLNRHFDLALPALQILRRHRTA